MEQNFILQSIADTFTGKPLHKLTIPVKNVQPPKKIIVSAAQPIIVKRTIWDKIFRRPIAPQSYTEEIVRYEDAETSRTYEIKPCVVANMYRVAGRASQLPKALYSHKSDNLKFIPEHMPTIAYIVAAAIQNNHLEPDQELIQFIELNLDADEMYEALKAVFSSLRMDSFTNSIVLMTGTVGILDQQTSPADGSELIASLIQTSDQLANTSGGQNGM